jgi:hypothetical protein
MKLLMVSGFWPTRKNLITGIFVQQQIEEYSRQGHQVSVISPVRLRRKRPFYLEHAGTIIYSPVSFIPPGLSHLPSTVQAALFPVYLRQYAAAVSRTLLRYIDLPSIKAVHANGLTFAGLCLADVPALRGKRTVATIHGEDPLLMAMAATPRFRRTLARACERLDVVALCGTPLQSYANRLGIASEKIRIIPNGTFLPAEDLVSVKDDGNLRLISIANLAEHKNIVSNIIALSRLAKKYSIQYTIVGDGPQREFLGQQTKELGLTDRVSFVGRLDHDKTMNLLSQADIFLLPSLRESFGIVFIEAMARMKPVIGSLGTGAEDIIADGVNGFLVDPSDQMNIAQAIERLIIDADLRQKMGQAGLEIAKRFSWEANVRRYIELLQG